MNHHLHAADLHVEQPASLDAFEAAGPWAGRVLAGLGLPLTVLRKLLFWVGTEDDRQFRRDRFPIYLAETADGFYYGFPVLDRSPETTQALLAPGPPVSAIGGSSPGSGISGGPQSSRRGSASLSACQMSGSRVAATA